MMYKSDIEIAQSITPKHILDIANSAGIDQKYIEQYGKYKAKITFELNLSNGVYKDKANQIKYTAKNGIVLISVPCKKIAVIY